MKLGDAFHYVAHPIVRGVDAVFGSDLQNCAGCGNRQARWNQLSDDVLDFFAMRLTASRDQRSEVRGQKEQDTMQFIVTITRQALVEAESAEAAEEAAAKGEGETLKRNRTVEPKPVAQAAQPGQRPGQPVMRPGVPVRVAGQA